MDLHREGADAERGGPDARAKEGVARAEKARAEEQHRAVHRDESDPAGALGRAVREQEHLQQPVRDAHDQEAEEAERRGVGVARAGMRCASTGRKGARRFHAISAPSVTATTSQQSAASTWAPVNERRALFASVASRFAA